jgi:hypothetical protein
MSLKAQKPRERETTRQEQDIAFQSQFSNHRERLQAIFNFSLQQPMKAFGFPGYKLSYVTNCLANVLNEKLCLLLVDILLALPI